MSLPTSPCPTLFVHTEPTSQGHHWKWHQKIKRLQKQHWYFITSFWLGTFHFFLMLAHFSPCTQPVCKESPTCNFILTLCSIVKKVSTKYLDHSNHMWKLLHSSEYFSFSTSGSAFIIEVFAAALGGPLLSIFAVCLGCCLGCYKTLHG